MEKRARSATAIERKIGVFMRGIIAERFPRSPKSSAGLAFGKMFAVAKDAKRSRSPRPLPNYAPSKYVRNFGLGIDYQVQPYVFRAASCCAAACLKAAASDPWFADCQRVSSRTRATA